MNFGVIVLIVFGTSVWAGIDAGGLFKEGATRKDLGGGPATIFFGCLLVWIIAFPLLHR